MQKRSYWEGHTTKKMAVRNSNEIENQEITEYKTK